jgi:hypothetical protein
MRLTVEEHCAHTRRTGHFLRVLVNGQDVTDRAYLADDAEGWVDCLALDAEGRKYFDRDRNDIARERLSGVVAFRPAPATDDQRRNAMMFAARGHRFAARKGDSER